MTPTLQLVQLKISMSHTRVSNMYRNSSPDGNREQNLPECHLVLDWWIVFFVPRFVSTEPFAVVQTKEQFCHLVPLKSF